MKLFTAKVSQGVPFVPTMYPRHESSGHRPVQTNGINYLSKSLENHNQNFSNEKKYTDIITTLKKRDVKKTEIIESLTKKLK